MATIKSTLALEDRMSPTVDKIAMSLAKATREMETASTAINMSNAVYEDMAFELKKVQTELQKAQNSTRTSATEIEKLEKRVQSLNKHTNEARLQAEKSGNTYLNAADKVDSLTRKQQEVGEASKKSLGVVEKSGHGASEAMQAMLKGVQALPIPMGKFGNIGIQALKGVVGGLTQAELAALAFNTAITLGIGILIALIIKAASFMKQKFGEVVDFFKNIYSSVADMAKDSIGTLDEWSAAYKAQVESGLKLAAIMRTRTSATNDEIQSVMDLTTAQQKLGIIGADLQTAGAAQLAMRLKSAESIKILIPLVNDLVVKEKGYNATMSDVSSTAQKVGRALGGEITMLKRLGIEFSAAEEKILKTGDEQERVALLAEVIRRNVGGMNEAFANTPLGRQEQLAITLDDLHKKFGKVKTVIEDIYSEALVKLVEYISTNLQPAIEGAFQFIEENADSIVAGLGILTAAGILFFGMWALGWALANIHILAVIGVLALFANSLTEAGMSGEEVFARLVAVIVKVLLNIANGAITVANVFATMFAGFQAGVSIFLGAASVVIGGLASIVKAAVAAQTALERVFNKDYQPHGAAYEVATGLEQAADKLAAGSKSMAASAKDVKLIEKLDAEGIAQSAYDLALGIGKELKGGITGITDKFGKIEWDGAGILDALDDYSDTTGGGKALKTAEQNELGIKDEDLKMLHDIATREYQLTYQQITPQLAVEIGVVRETTDLDSVMNYFADGILEAASTKLVVPS